MTNLLEGFVLFTIYPQIECIARQMGPAAVSCICAPGYTGDLCEAQLAPPGEISFISFIIFSFSNNMVVCVGNHQKFHLRGRGICQTSTD